MAGMSKMDQGSWCTNRFFDETLRENMYLIIDGLLFEKEWHNWMQKCKFAGMSIMRLETTKKCKTYFPK